MNLLVARWKVYEKIELSNYNVRNFNLDFEKQHWSIGLKNKQII